MNINLEELKQIQVGLDQAERAVNDARVSTVLANVLYRDEADDLVRVCDSATDAIWQLQETVEKALLIIG